VRSLTFVVPGNPIPQGSKRAMVSRSTNRPIVVDANRIGLAEWRADIAAHAMRALANDPDHPNQPFLGAVWVGLRFTFTRPATHWLPVNIKRSAPELRRGAPLVHTQTPDIDKLARAVLDALTNANVFPDDAVVSTLIASKGWSSKDEQPGVVVTVESVEWVSSSS
jgi:hypothetical protein